ncbi:MAG: NTP transferase domain-containing protein [FCB group bacterium]|nr:NTP transferase domain-containing protein [FCB group bacterium]
MHHVILAGGTGTRFWPYSRKRKPKQLLSILGEKSMIRLTYERLAAISPDDQIYVVASEQLCKLIQQELPELSAENFIIEPSGKNTAPAIALAALRIAGCDDDTMGVYPADHLIRDEQAFCASVKLAAQQVRSTPSLVTMGIPPTYPATGYGYIQFMKAVQGVSPGINKVRTFTEKPELETAKRFIKSGDYLWNSGMFIWRAKTILDAIKSTMPELHPHLMRIGDAIGTSSYKDVLTREWQKIRPESIDYGVLEKSKIVYTLSVEFGWSDLGSWKSLFEELETDSEHNVFRGLVSAIDTTNTLVFSPDHLTAVVGMENVAVINVQGVTLVMPLHEAEKVKEIVNLLKKSGKEEFL